MNETISRAVVADAACLEGATAASLQRRMKGRRMTGTGRRGKYLFLDFGDETVLVMHFGPAGSLSHMSAGEDAPDYVRFRLDFSNDESLAYVNRRRIGRVRLIDDAAAFITRLRLGPDAMDPDFDAAAFEKRIGGRKQAIKLVLMDQSRIAGIGNTWSDEILFRARIDPTVPAADLTPERSKELFRITRKVFRAAIDLDPTAADFRDRLPVGFLLPHRRPGGHCPRCGAELKRVAIGGHTSTYCPHCQR